MAHTRPEDILDLKSELAAIRTLDRIVEKKPGIFYWKAIPFLHFHFKNEARWADVKTPKGWEQVPIDFQSTALTRKKFMQSVTKAHAVLAQGKIKK
jgi:hypothetical protein